MTDEKKPEVNLEDVLVKLTALEGRTIELEEENKVLKAHADETIKEKKAMKARLDEDQATRDRELEEKVNRTKEETDTLIKQYKERNTALEDKIKGLEEKEYKNNVRAEALKLAGTLTKDDASKELLADKIERQIKLDEASKLQVLDDKGNPTISSVEQLVKTIADRYPRLVDGIDSTGGGSHSSAGAQSKSYTELSESEKVELKRTDPVKWQELRASAITQEN